MLSKEDLNNYLKQIDKLENDMLHLYKTCADSVEDENIKKICAQLSQSEASHRVLVNRVIGLLRK